MIHYTHVSAFVSNYLLSFKTSVYMYMEMYWKLMLYCVQVEALKRELEAAIATHESDVGRMREKTKELKGQHQREVKGQ